MAIFSFSEMFGQLRSEMTKSRKTRIDETKIAMYLGRFTAAKGDRPMFETILADLEADKAVSSSDLITIASTYNKGGRKPSSRAAAFAMIKKRLVEIVRFHAKNKVAEKARPW